MRRPVLPSSLVILLRRVTNVSLFKILVNTNSFLVLEILVIFFGNNLQCKLDSEYRLPLLPRYSHDILRRNWLYGFSSNANEHRILVRP
jgi:hypothetical protein